MIGIHCCGKSVMLELIERELTEFSVSPTQFVSINFEDMNLIPNSLFNSSFSSCFGLKFLILVYSVQSTYTDHAEGKRTHSIYTCPPYFETNRASSFKQNLLCLLLDFRPQRLEAKTPFEMSRAFFSALSGCFYREKPHRAKNESGMNHFLRHHQNASCKKDIKKLEWFYGIL